MAWVKTATKLVGWLALAPWFMATTALALDWPTKPPQTEAEMQAWSDLVEARRQAIETALRQQKAVQALSEAEELVAYVDRTQPKGATARVIARELAGRAAMVAQDQAKVLLHYMALMEEAEAAGLAQDAGLFIPSWALGELFYVKEDFSQSQRWLERARALAGKANVPPATRVTVLARLFDATLRSCLGGRSMTPPPAT